MLRKIMCLLVVAVLLGIGSAQGAIVVDNGLSFTIDLNDGAFINNNAADKNLFSNELISMGDGTTVSAPPLELSEIPYLPVNGINYFQFVYDTQEEGNAQEIWIVDIVLTAGGTLVWDYDDKNRENPIILNRYGYEPTASPNGQGGDMALYVPVSLFAGLTGRSLLTMSVTQNYSGNGGDEWVVLGDDGGGSFFGLDDPIGNGTPAVPEPATLAIWSLLGVAGLALRRFKAA